MLWFGLFFFAFFCECSRTDCVCDANNIEHNRNIFAAFSAILIYAFSMYRRRHQTDKHTRKWKMKKNAGKPKTECVSDSDAITICGNSNLLQFNVVLSETRAPATRKQFQTKLQANVLSTINGCVYAVCAVFGCRRLFALCRGCQRALSSIVGSYEYFVNSMRRKTHFGFRSLTTPSACSSYVSIFRDDNALNKHSRTRTTIPGLLKCYRTLIGKMSRSAQQTRLRKKIHTIFKAIVTVIATRSKY